MLPGYSDPIKARPFSEAAFDSVFEFRHLAEGSEGSRLIGAVRIAVASSMHAIEIVNLMIKFDHPFRFPHGIKLNLVLVFERFHHGTTDAIGQILVKAHRVDGTAITVGGDLMNVRKKGMSQCLQREDAGGVRLRPNDRDADIPSIQLVHRDGTMEPVDVLRDVWMGIH